MANNNNNQQAKPQFLGDLFNHNPSNMIQGGFLTVQYCSALYVILEKTKELSFQLYNQDPNNELWRKMVLYVPFTWIQQNNAGQFRRELEKYKEQLDGAVTEKIHPNDINWMKAYVKAMIDILTPYSN